MHHKYHHLSLFERSVQTMFGMLLILALVYCAVLLSLVFSVIEKKQNTLASRDLTSRLSMLEATYTNSASSITEETLTENKYRRVSDATFAVRKDQIASYTVLYAH